MLTSATPACMNGIPGDAPSRFENLLDGLTSAGLRGVEAGIRAGDGTPLLHFNGDTDKPALLVKTHGLGNVVYLNLGVTKYGFSPLMVAKTEPCSAHAKTGAHSSYAQGCRPKLPPLLCTQTSDKIQEAPAQETYAS